MIATATDASAAPERAFLRPYLNGAGPSAVFRAGRVNGQDVIGVVDPVRWRIQYYLLEPWTPNGAPLAERLRAAGDCALAPTFRVWRAHLHAQRIVLQSQPEGGAALLSPAPLRHRRLEISTTPATLAAIARGSPTPDDAMPATPCSGAGVDGGDRPFRERDAAAIVTGGAGRPFTLRRRGPQASRFLARALTPVRSGAFQASVQELEDARQGGVETRHFQVTARGGRPGFVVGELSIVRRGSRVSADSRMRIDPMLTRVKMAQRPIAISSAGEVLVLSANDRSGVFLTSCRFEPGVREQVPCRIEERAVLAAPAPALATPREELGPRPTRRQVWEQALWYASRLYEVDAAAIPNACRGVRPCNLGGGLLWSPLSELRFARGPVRRRGAPYGQSQSDAFRPRWQAASGSPVTLPAFRNGGPIRVFGDIENGRAAWAPDQVQIVGIDCSALVSHLWGRRTALGTAEFILLANRGGYARVGSLAEVRMGDAFLINLVDGADRDRPMLINHIALFRETRPAGPADSSRAILVLEANAACGGVCWSLYDEAFFTGWAILRNERGGPSAQITDAIPTDIGAWRRLFAP